MKCPTWGPTGDKKSRSQHLGRVTCMCHQWQRHQTYGTPVWTTSEKKLSPIFISAICCTDRLVQSHVIFHWVNVMYSCLVWKLLLITIWFLTMTVTYCYIYINVINKVLNTNTTFPSKHFICLHKHLLTCTMYSTETNSWLFFSCISYLYLYFDTNTGWRLFINL